MPDRFRPVCWLIAAGIAALALWFGVLAFAANLPMQQWLSAAMAPPPGDVTALLFHYSLLPRSAVAFLAGAILGMAGAMLQQSLQNPLASPSTLGVAAGAQLALALALLWMPDLIGGGRALIGMVGGGGAILIVLALSRRGGFAPVTVLLAGVIVALLAGTLGAALVLFNDHRLGGLFVWGSGSLVQDGWEASRRVLAAGLAGTVVLLIFRRSFSLLGLGDEAAALGLSVAGARLLFIGLAVALTGTVVGHVGVIGFIGLAAPALCRVMGFRRAIAVALASGPAGGFLLSGTDSLLQILAATGGISLPTGAVAALFGGPLLVVMIRRLRGFPIPATARADRIRRSARPGMLLGALLVLLAASVVLSLVFNVLPDGHLGFARGDILADLLPWRWPRVFAALAAGALLAASGLVLQRLTGNPAASPELLGVSAGAALGLAAVLLWVPAPGYGLQLLATGGGAGAVLALLLFLSARAAAPPEFLLLTGIALSAAVSAVLTILMASGDPRMMLIANWMAGSTYDAPPPLAIGLLITVAGLFGASLTCVRWLAIVPLGSGVARGVGLPLSLARLLLLGLSATMAAAATLAVGPLSFVGLLAPHLALRMGLGRALPQLVGSMLAGSIILVLADWLGRNLWFPFQIPAGLLASLIGCPALVWFLSKRR